MECRVPVLKNTGTRHPCFYSLEGGRNMAALYQVGVFVGELQPEGDDPPLDLVDFIAHLLLVDRVPREVEDVGVEPRWRIVGDVGDGQVGKVPLEPAQCLERRMNRLSVLKLVLELLDG